jgi:hypothetical protein
MPTVLDTAALRSVWEKKVATRRDYRLGAVQPPETAGITWIVEPGRTGVSSPAGSLST